MRVLFINDVYTVGGATKSLKDLLSLLVKQGVDPIVCTSKRDGLNDYLDEKGILNIVDGHEGAMDVAPKKSLKRPFQYYKRKLRYRQARKKALRRIEKTIDLSTIDIIHTNSARNDIGCLIHEKYGTPHLVHIREFGQEDFSCWVYRNNYGKYISKQCDWIVAVSDAVKKSWIKKGIYSDKISTLYNGVNFEGFQIKPTDSYSEEKMRIVFVGGLCETKGQHIALEAVGMLPECIRNNISLDFIGWSDPVYLAQLIEYAKKHNLDKRVRFLGSKEDVSTLLWKYDVGLMCSKSEGFGRVTVEYMYAGLGVIAADTGASPELVKDGISGLIYSRDNASDLADKIEKYYRDRKLLKDCGERAHIVSAQQFTIERNVSELLQVYQKVILKNETARNEKS